MRTLLACAVALIVLGPASIHAESYVVRGENGSFLIFDYEGDFFKLTGDGFEVSDRGAFGLSIPRIMDTCSVCAAGDIVNVSFRTPGDDVAIGSGLGRATFGGVTYENISYRGRLELIADPLVLPDLDTDFFRPALPFRFMGSLRGFLGDTEVFAGSFTGVGTAYIPFFRSNEAYIWEEGRLDYWFRTPDPAPVPEPATMVLLGTGLLGLLGGHRRSRRS